MKLIKIFKLFFQKDKNPFDELEKNGCKIPQSTRVSMHSPNGVDHLFPFLVEIGENCKISTQVSMLAHDASTSTPCNVLKIGKVSIGNNCFIGHKVTILPGVTIGDNTIIGANSLISADCQPNSVYAGNPARLICSIDEYIKKIQLKTKLSPTFEHKDGYKHFNYQEFPEECNKMREQIFKSKIGFIRLK